MKISLKNQTIERKNSDLCHVTEHPLDDSMLNFATIKLTGRYPDVKRATNQQCKELVYVHEGSGEVVVEGERYVLNAGDIVLIEAGEKYYWQGNMHLFISCHPAWTKDQHQLVD
jgi:mannose-6-phosphate isomerase-like protein (cupin superfamily)